MKTGIVKFYNEQKGFGFIIQDNHKDELFFHATQCVGHLPKENSRVEYEHGEGKRGPQAMKVRVL